MCSLRGGALKATTSNLWCHIVCALTIKEVNFVSAAKKGPISVTDVPLARLKLVGF